MKHLKIPAFMLCAFLSGSSMAQDAPEEKIRLNQLGFYPNAPKKAVIVNSDATRFAVVSEESKDTVLKGDLKPKGVWQWSQENVSMADLSALNKAGKYFIHVPDLGNSYTFEIGSSVHLDAGIAGLKLFYFNRASTELRPEHAGKWARKAGHPDTEVYVHNSAASAGRPANSTISSPLGWYDAGDYNKYIVNSGITMGTLLSLYEDFPEFLDGIKVDIPESNNELPDIIDEILWNLRWMLTMQDPEDGGVYHKLTNPNFDGSIMPERATGKRFVVQKGTAASLDFAAVTAQASRILRKFEKQLPGLADSCLAASKAAYAWAKKNPDVAYVQKELSDPVIQTGEYGDGNFADEFQWANLELFVTTGDIKYYKDADLASTLKTAFKVPAWPDVNTLGLYSLARFRDKYAKVEGVDMRSVTDQLIAMADAHKKHAAVSEYGIPMGIEENNFVWGSNSVAANQGILLLNAYRFTKDRSYFDAALANLDYLMGRNATGFSFLTGYGSKPTMNPHHRPSEADRIPEPVPGMLAGGPNPGQQDMVHCRRYKEKHQYPATSYIDEKCSYASNEIAINWNAPYAYLALAIEAIYKDLDKQQSPISENLPKSTKKKNKKK